uniref:NADH-ubiquinone oxidoreductase chain 6 n=1 Tax=Istiophorus platypterus TaxID=13575 RepID=C4B7M0_ISTPL|nr:NADH dehydrogenase subunit 6 [Istiophorus platypterus]WCO09555.1 NADH dehydrogenase subunit 6 [Istiophorus platypterus]WCO09581.1 NADH dehydrogenase subunit 6 [Istiophorus platypterus]WCO09633.1 NADH dehydrogenase subunit 6 [Istiophorus platypterus]WCO09659.1 NADH dehydrogenase subunit 6 [Istiophorus platypterus]WCO09672.1 NADH dehydrogenase subunit 6 [Istiophorus platypterus]
MTFIMYLILLSFVLGLVAVASNPSPYFAALGLVVVAGMGCGVLVGHGGPFLSLVLFLIYLGGMLVVFAYSAALAAEPYPETWGSRPVVAYMVVYMVGVVLVSGLFWGGWYESSWVSVDELGEFSVFRGDVGGVALMYSSGGWMLIISAWVLLLTLFVVLELTRGLSRGALRAV